MEGASRPRPHRAVGVVKISKAIHDGLRKKLPDLAIAARIVIFHYDFRHWLVAEPFSPKRDSWRWHFLHEPDFAEKETAIIVNVEQGRPAQSHNV